jgi:hypothetical protein
MSDKTLFNKPTRSPTMSDTPLDNTLFNKTTNNPTTSDTTGGAAGESKREKPATGNPAKHGNAP